MNNTEPTTLLTAIRAKCAARGWYGPDALQPQGSAGVGPDGTETTLQRRDFLPPVSEVRLQAAERSMGVALPPVLRAIYCELTDGKIGPAYGLVTLDELRTEYEGLCGLEVLAGEWQWPPTLLPFAYWNDLTFSFVDLDSGIVVSANRDEVSDAMPDAFVAQAPSLQAWFAIWLQSDVPLYEWPDTAPDVELPPVLDEYVRLTGANEEIQSGAG